MCIAGHLDAKVVLAEQGHLREVVVHVRHLGHTLVVQVGHLIGAVPRQIAEMVVEAHLECFG